MKNIWRKIWVISLLMLLISVNISALVTLNNEGLTTTDSSFRLDFDDDYASFINITINGSKIIDDSNISNWTTAYGWGDHSIQNYLDDDVADDVDDADIDWGSGAGQVDTDDIPEGTNKFASLLNMRTNLWNQWLNLANISINNYNISSGNITNWDTAYSERGSQIAGDNLTWSAGQLHAIGGADGYYNVTKIWNSNDNNWTANTTNLQDAVYNLNSTSGGWVQVPVGIISDVSLKIPDDVWLRGYGNKSVLKKANNDNGYLISNVDTVNGNDGIIISDLCLDGNAMVHNTYPANSPTTRPHIVYFERASNVTIRNCEITHSPGAGVFWWYVNNSKIVDTTISHSGKQFEGTWVNNHIPKGFFGEGITNCQFRGLTIHDCFATGFSPEAHFGVNTLNSSKWILSDSHIYNCHDGIYLERTKDGIISNVHTFSNNKEEAYTSEEPDGIVLGRWVENITLIGVHSYDNGNLTSGNEGHGLQMYSIDVANITVIGGRFYNNKQRGINVGHVDNFDISYCTVYDNGVGGIYVDGTASYGDISHNRIDGSPKGIYIMGTTHNTSAIWNILTSCSTYAIQESATCAYNEIMFNKHIGLSSDYPNGVNTRTNYTGSNWNWL